MSESDHSHLVEIIPSENVYFSIEENFSIVYYGMAIKNLGLLIYTPCILYLLMILIGKQVMKNRSPYKPG